jgi:hypothetical protein
METPSRSHYTTDCLVLWSSSVWSQPDRLPNSRILIDGAWHIHSFLWTPDSLCWGVVARKGRPASAPWTASGPALARIKSRPSLAVSRCEALRRIESRIARQQARCGARCSGPQGHTCQLSDDGHLPQGLFPLIDLLNIDTDLCADLFHVCPRPSITKWYSKFQDDVGLGALGNVLSSSAALGGRMLAFPPPPDPCSPISSSPVLQHHSPLVM